MGRCCKSLQIVFNQILKESEQFLVIHHPWTFSTVFYYSFQLRSKVSSIFLCLWHWWKLLHLIIQFCSRRFMKHFTYQQQFWLSRMPCVYICQNKTKKGKITCYKWNKTVYISPNILYTLDKTSFALSLYLSLSQWLTFFLYILPGYRGIWIIKTSNIFFSYFDHIVLKHSSFHLNCFVQMRCIICTINSIYLIQSII